MRDSFRVAAPQSEECRTFLYRPLRSVKDSWIRPRNRFPTPFVCLSGLIRGRLRDDGVSTIPAAKARCTFWNRVWMWTDCDRCSWRFLPSICHSCNCFPENPICRFSTDPQNRKRKHTDACSYWAIHRSPRSFSDAATRLSAGCSNRNKESWIRTDLRCRDGWTAIYISLFYPVWHLSAGRSGLNGCKNHAGIRE